MKRYGPTLLSCVVLAAAVLGHRAGPAVAVDDD